ncbi:S1 RNA-binding domain-containing protein [Sediminibacillus terrae]|uniref:CvfB family protein n=1 Tax=Sediminibacillus terrae TaxID=1562106 RepID=UPI0003F96FFA|nr:S1-like domain-containing RNA-binding protein [Sediminibacillus terrae]
MSELQPGTIQRAKITNSVTDGFLVSIGTETLLLPEINTDLQPGKEIKVFVYQDRKGKLLATETIPEASLDSYGWAKVVEVVENLGVFVDIGIPKEILVSSDDLPLLKKVWPISGDYLFVSLDFDKKGRLLAKPINEADVMADLVPASPDLLQHRITGRVYRSTKAGSFILSEEGYRGFIHPHERKKEPRIGETVTGRIIDVKDDGTINVTLLPLKQEGMKDDAESILEYLEKRGGAMEFGDKSDAEAIRETFHISKSAFKRALGNLIKENKVYQQDGKTYLK